MQRSPKKGWVYLAVNETICVLLYSLVTEKLKRKRLNKEAKNDLIVIQSLLYQVLAKPTDLPSEEDK